MASQTVIKKRITGSVFEIVHCAGALDSLDEALESIPKNKRQSWLRGVNRQFERLANGQRLSKENFPTEGELPRRPGQQVVKHFKALKRIPLRAYLWKSERFENRYYVSHYVYKNYDRLKPKDTDLVARNWRAVEEHQEDE
ncbi:hypothetical protein [Pseudidiomarina woesei]|uniref:Uncharacterized protein n=1 Tax=Pseudidiomarina woesei TaxID=1381080 RepID=A0A0K6GZB3_9GAMM|nr:hypothetical protein [Pseudidiomarina woesei]CUA83964.1 hypothetical protein Ga0061064_0824 [Pseudidiomarina woesei]